MSGVEGFGSGVWGLGLGFWVCGFRVVRSRVVSAKSRVMLYGYHNWV